MLPSPAPTWRVDGRRRGAATTRRGRSLARAGRAGAGAGQHAAGPPPAARRRHAGQPGVGRAARPKLGRARRWHRAMQRPPGRCEPRCQASNAGLSPQMAKAKAAQHAPLVPVATAAKIAGKSVSRGAPCPEARAPVLTPASEGSKAVYCSANNVWVIRRWCSRQESPNVTPPQQCRAEQSQQRSEHQAYERALKDGRLLRRLCPARQGACRARLQAEQPHTAHR